MVYAASIRAELDSLWLKFDILFNVLPSPIYILSLKFSEAANLLEIFI